MPASIVRPTPQLLLAVASTGTTATSPAFSLPLSNRFTFYMNVTTATAGTLDTVFLTSVDGGTTYVNVPWRFAQATTATGCFVLNVRAGLGNGYDNTAPTGTGILVADTGGALALSCVPDFRYMQFKYTIGTGPYVFNLYVVAWPLGTPEME